MRDKVVNKIMFKIKETQNIDDIKYEEIRYGLQGLYTMITKTSIILIIACLLNILKEFIICFLFYSLLRSVGFGAHAKSNIQCWIFSISLLIGIPIIFSHINISLGLKIFIWSILFINFFIFCPADTKKRPMINKKRKLKFKYSILILCVVYLFLIIYLKSIANLILGAMLLEGLLVNPLGYIIMGEEVRFSLKDLYIFKLN